MNKLSLILLSAAALTALSGCIEPRTEWVKDGANPEELRYTRQSCERDAQGYAFIEERTYDDVARTSRGNTSARSDIYRRCMEGQGWRRQRSDQPK
jgi:hypothetical protein